MSSNNEEVRTNLFNPNYRPEEEKREMQSSTIVSQRVVSPSITGTQGIPTAQTRLISNQSFMTPGKQELARNESIAQIHYEPRTTVEYEARPVSRLEEVVTVHYEEVTDMHYEPVEKTVYEPVTTYFQPVETVEYRPITQYEEVRNVHYEPVGTVRGEAQGQIPISSQIYNNKVQVSPIRSSQVISSPIRGSYVQSSPVYQQYAEASPIRGSSYGQPLYTGSPGYQYGGMYSQPTYQVGGYINQIAYPQYSPNPYYR